MGVGHDLLSYLTRLARRRGLPGFAVEVSVREQVDVRPFSKIRDLNRKREAIEGSMNADDVQRYLMVSLQLGFDIV